MKIREIELLEKATNFRLLRFVNQWLDCFVDTKNVVGSIPTGAPNQSKSLSFSLLFFWYKVLHNIDASIIEVKYRDINVIGESDKFSITSLCESMVDCFAFNKNVVGSIPTEAPTQSKSLSFSLFSNLFFI